VVIPSSSPMWWICGLLDPFGNFPSTSNNDRSFQWGAARHWHGLDIQDEWHLKDFAVIFIILLRFFVLFDVSLNVRVLFAKKCHYLFFLDHVRDVLIIILMGGRCAMFSH
jgi:hypothetical protein